jgi:hypothetical protein
LQNESTLKCWITNIYKGKLIQSLGLSKINETDELLVFSSIGDIKSLVKIAQDVVWFYIVVSEASIMNILELDQNFSTYF